MILIIKTAPDKYLLKALEKFGSGEEVCLLVQPSARENIRKEFPDCHIMVFPKDGKFEISHVTVDFIRTMSKCRFSKIILLYNTNSRMSYEHLETLARAIDSPRVLGMYPDGSAEDLVATPFGMANMIIQSAAGRIGVGTNAGRFVSTLLAMTYLHIHFKSLEVAEHLTRPVASAVTRRHKNREKQH